MLRKGRNGFREELNPSCEVRSSVTCCVTTRRANQFGFTESVSSPSGKNISVLQKGKSPYMICHPVPFRGAFRERQERGAGMRWTRQRRARGHGRRAGEIWSPVSGQGAETTGVVSVRKNRVGLTPQGWRQTCGGLSSQPGSGGAIIRRRRCQTSRIAGASAR